MDTELRIYSQEGKILDLIKNPEIIPVVGTYHVRNNIKDEEEEFFVTKVRIKPGRGVVPTRVDCYAIL